MGSSGALRLIGGALVCFVCGVPQAEAHAVAGARVFVNTLLIDDPGVG